MEKLRRRLPPLTGLVIFEAAARLLSFTSAAREMCVTQAAVSRQIRVLEESLGQPLFVRGHRNISLTSAGRRLYATVDQSLERIADTVHDLRNGVSGVITFAATIGFSTYWLRPRLQAFQRAHPDIGVRLLALDRDFDLVGENIDIGFTTGSEGQGPGVRLDRLFDETILAVCSPSYLGDRQLHEPQQLLEERLLHLDREHWRWIRWPVVDWPVWLQQMGVTYAPPTPALSFNNSALLFQAALEGEGIALGWGAMIDDLLESGALVRVLPHEYRTSRGYYLALNPTSVGVSEAEVFREWLLADMARR
jgi:DNA-binding transcriptional LysR family regulator